MRWVEAREQLCKMQAEIAARLGLETECVCVCTSSDNVVPDQVIEEMWRRLTHPCWVLVETFNAQPAQQRDHMLMAKETFDMLVQTWIAPNEEK